MSFTAYTDTTCSPLPGSEQYSYFNQLTSPPTAPLSEVKRLQQAALFGSGSSTGVTRRLENNVVQTFPSDTTEQARDKRSKVFDRFFKLTDRQYVEWSGALKGTLLDLGEKKNLTIVSFKLFYDDTTVESEKMDLCNDYNIAKGGRGSTLAKKAAVLKKWVKKLEILKKTADDLADELMKAHTAYCFCASNFQPFIALVHNFFENDALAQQVLGSNKNFRHKYGKAVDRVHHLVDLFKNRAAKDKKESLEGEADSSKRRKLEEPFYQLIDPTLGLYLYIYIYIYIYMQYTKLVYGFSLS